MNIDKQAVRAELMASPHPPWRPMPSREVARLVGASLQSLANWRIRGTGPEPEPAGTGRGNRTYYRPDKLLAWLAGGEWWVHSGVWLDERGLGVEVETEATVMERIALLERMRAFG